MYGWLWNRLPGSLAVKLLESLVLFAVVVVVLFAFVFPVIEPHLPLTQTTVNH